MTTPHSSAEIERPRPGRALRRTSALVGLGAVGVGMLVAALFGAAGNPPCASSTGPVGPIAAGHFAAPLTLAPGQTFEVGATQYGGPDDPSSGDIGSSGTYLPSDPDSFAELSTLDANPANTGGSFSFDDADALGALPYGTALRVTHDGRSRVLIKRDIGYGQGPGQTIPYRIDVWWQAAAQLAITKSTVQIERLPDSGSGGLLGQMPSSADPRAASNADGCGTGTAPVLPVVPGQVAQIDPLTGLASAPASAPRAVKLVIAAANQLIDRPYLWGGGHEDLNQLADGYDCSGSVEYALHQAGLFAPSQGPSSTAFESYYPTGPGRWITVYANPQHMWLVVAGIVLNTAWYAPVTPTSPSSGPRWQPLATAQEQIAGNTSAGYPSFAVSHPDGL